MIKNFYEIRVYDEDGDYYTYYYQNLETANKLCERIITDWYNEDSLNYDTDISWTLEKWLSYWRNTHEIYERLELFEHPFND